VTSVKQEPGFSTEGDLSRGEGKQALATHIEGILTLLGYNLQDPHFLRTAKRASDVLWAYHSNGDEAAAEKLLDVQFDADYDSLVMVGPINVTSMCAHHMLPVTGQAWVGYLPDGRVTGLSKLSRIVGHYAHQFTVQETVTQQVANALDAYLKPKGAMVVIRAEHGCMSLRGVREPEALTTTSAVRGVFKNEDSARAEFLSLIGR